MFDKIKVDKKLMDYLHIQSPKTNRGNVIAFVLLFMDFFGLFPLLGDPFSSRFFIAAIIPAAIIHIWAIIYVIQPYRFEHSYYLFMGIYGIVNTYIYFLVIQKLLYVHVGVTGRMPFVLGVILFIALLGFFNWLGWKAYYSEKFTKLQFKVVMYFSWVVVIGIGIPFGSFATRRMYSESIQMFAIILVISVLSVLIAFLFSTSIHRYFLIKNNIKMVNQVHPGFGLSKEARLELFKIRQDQRKNIKNPSRKNRKKRMEKQSQSQTRTD